MGQEQPEIEAGPLAPNEERAPEGSLLEDRPIVAFDFDGTLTVRDSYTAFLKWRAGPKR
jgi:phosphatidylglycerophosphatase C